MKFYLPDKNGTFNHRAGFAGRLNINILQKKGVFTIFFPDNLFTGSKKVVFSWIDNYR